MPKWLKPSLDWLLVFVPVALIMGHTSSANQTFLFFACCLAILPLAGWMGKATEHLAERTGDAIGGLLNATFGNAAELIIALMALKAGKMEIVKASLTGSIIGNILLVMGLALLAGGIRFKKLTFNTAGARMQTTMLTLAAIGLICPAAYKFAVAPLHTKELPQELATLSLWIAVVLLITYALGLFFSLVTHKSLFLGTAGASTEKNESDGNTQKDSHNEKHVAWSLKKTFGILFGATALVALVSETLVASVEHAAKDIGMSQVFVGVIVVAVIGNAAEHSTAILMALKNKMELSIGIAIGSSIQIALFVAPVLVFASYLFGTPMDLVFSLPEVICVGMSVIIMGQIAGDGEANWMEGVQLLSVYAIMAILFYFLPDVPSTIPIAGH